MEEEAEKYEDGISVKDYFMKTGYTRTSTLTP